MRKLTVVENVTLDGVMQAPGAPDEDTRGGFAHGGWARPYADDTMFREMGKGMGTTDLLFGRRTYENFYGFWPKQTDGNLFTHVLNASQKYVASRTLRGPLPWENSTLLEGDAAAAVRRLKEEPGKDVVVLGSGELVRSLAMDDLVDEYVLLIHPLVLGSGRRLWEDGAPLATWDLASSVATTTGVIIATYARGDGPREERTTGGG
jgi:dihydrofolate reductase